MFRFFLKTPPRRFSSSSSRALSPLFRSFCLFLYFPPHFFFLPSLLSFPFLLVDRVVELVPQKYAVGYKVRKSKKVFLLNKVEGGAE